MSYIEKKFKNEITLVFEELSSMEKGLMELLKEKSLQKVEEIAKVCSELVKKINLILKKFYPEIKDMEDKIIIKSSLRFYYDLIEKLTTYIRHVENFRQIDENVLNSLKEHVQEKKKLINGKFKELATRELTTFYNPKARKELESILEDKIRTKEREFFTFGTFEQEIKKKARLAGATEIMIFTASSEEREKINFAQSLIHFKINKNDDDLLEKVGNEIQSFLLSKGYKVKLDRDKLFTDARLLPDAPKK